MDTNQLLSTNALDKLLTDTFQISTQSEQAKSEAKQASVAACRAMESALVKALAGGRLRGVECLFSGCDGNFLGYRVRGNDPTKELEQNRTGGGVKALCINELGKLVIAWADYSDDSANVQPAQDIVFNAEDAEELARMLEYALPIHIEKSKKSHKRYSELKSLNSRLLAAFAEPTDTQAEKV